MSYRFPLISKVFLAGLWLVCLYRAATQSVVHDEALTWELYLSTPFSAIFSYYDANHHFLSTILMRLSVSLFGLSEVTMRFPALASAALYFYAVYHISRRMFPEGPMMLLSIAALTLNPMVLDFMVAARGYGMALAFLFWSISILADYFGVDGNARRPRELAKAGAALALSVMANLVFVFPAAVIAAGVIVLLGKERRASEPEPVVRARPAKEKKRSPAPVVRQKPSWLYFAVPIGALAVTFFLAAPIDKVSGEQLYTGASSLTESLRSLSITSIARDGPLDNVAKPAVGVVAFAAAPLILIGAFVVGFRTRDVWLLTASVISIGSAVLVVLCHFAFSMPLPADRTGLYFLPLVSLALASLARVGPAGIRITGIVLSAVSIVVFGSQFSVRYFDVWKYDADTRALAQRLTTLVGSSPSSRPQISHSWQLEPALNFYRAKNKWAWSDGFERGSITAGANYYALIPMDQGAITRLSLKPIYTGPVSGVVLATPGP